MALEEKTVTFPMKFGLDQGTDEVADDVAGLLSLVNGVFDKDGAVSPRGGFEVLEDLPGTPRGLVTTDRALGVVTADGITPFIPGVGAGIKNTLLDAEVTGQLYFYNGRNIRFATAARMTVDDVEYTLVASLEANTSGIDGDLVVYLFAGDSLIQEVRSGDGKYIAVKVVAEDVTGRFHVFQQITDTSIDTRIVNTRYGPTPSGFSTVSATTIAAAGEASPIPLDAVAYTEGSAVRPYVSWVNAAETNINVTNVVQGTTLSVVDTPRASTTIYGSPDGNCLLVAYFDSADNVRVQSYTVAPFAVADEVTAGSVATPYNISMVLVSPGNITLAASSDFQVTTFGLLVSGTTLTAGAVQNVSLGVIAVSKITNRGFLAARTRAAVDALFGGFILNGTATPNGKFRTSVQAGFSEIVYPDLVNQVADVLVNGSTESYSFQAILQEDGEANEFEHRYRGKLLSIDYEPTTVSSTTVGGIAFIAASMPRTFDGSVSMAVGSAGPGPVISSAVPAASSAPQLSIGVYSYVTLVELTDTRGNIFLGPPTLLAQGTTTAGNQWLTIATIDLNIPSFTLYDHAELRVYRTEANGSVFHLHHTALMDPEVTSYDFVDKLPDLDLSTGEPLYTSLSGGALPSDSPPPLKHVWSHRNRLFGINSELPTQIWFTKETAAPFAGQWNSELIKNVENSGGPLIAGASLGDKCVLFQRNQILVFSGQGPDNLGNSPLDFSTPEVISHGVGAKDHESVVTVPGGILFRSDEGFYALGMDGAVQFVGKGILDDERTMGATQCAAYIPALHQVWFAGTEPGILVYDVRFNRWSFFDVPFSVSGIAEFNRVAYVLDTDAQIWSYNPSAVVDEVAGIETTIGLPWFRGGGPGGTFRVWRVIITVAREDTDSDTITARTFTMSPGRNRSKDPDVADATYVLAVPPNSLGPVELRLRPVKQRGSAFRCEITTGDALVAARTPRVISVKYVFGTETEDGKSPGTTVAS